MKHTGALIVLFLGICTQFLSAQTVSPLPLDMLRLLQDPAAVRRLEQSHSTGYRPVADLVVGYSIPGEVREITTPTQIYGNIIVMNGATLRFKNTDVLLQGNIFLLQRGKMEVTGGSFTISQYFMYQYSALLLNKSTLTLRDVTMHCSGLSYGCGLVDSTILTMSNVRFPEGIMTTTITGKSIVHASQAKNTGEFLFFDQTQGDFTDCEGLLTWFVAPSGSDIDVTFPGSTVGGSYVFPDSAKRASGVGYKLSYANCINMYWALMGYSGSTVRVTDSDLLASGAMFTGDGHVTVENLVNKSFLSSFQYPANDRDLIFVNTNVKVWNLYPMEKVTLNVQNCIFGEIITQQESKAFVVNSVCDGTGGYVGSMDSSHMMLVQCQILPEVNVWKKSAIYLVQCNVPTAGMHVSDNGLLALLNTSFSALPVTGTESVAIIGSIDEPGSGFTKQLLTVYGSARLVHDPALPVRVEGYWLDYRPKADSTAWNAIGGGQTGERYREPLGSWDTKSLPAGEYVLRLNIRINFGKEDTIRVERSVRLFDPPVGMESIQLPHMLSLEQNFPNPVQSIATIEYFLPELGSVSLKVFDVYGREIRTLVSSMQPEGRHSVDFHVGELPRGTYVYRLETNGSILSRVMNVLH